MAGRLAAVSAVVLSSVGVVVTAAASPASAAPATAITLTASSASAETGQYVTLTATANGDLGDNYLDIFNQRGYLVESCTWNPCTVDVTEYYATTESFIAYVDNDPDPGNYPPNGISAASNPVSVTWYDPPPPPPAPRASDVYCPSPVEVLNGNTLGVYNKLAVQTGSPTAVCVRVDAAGVGYGGALVVGAPGGGLPTTDADAAACQNVWMNQVVLGQRFILATGGVSGETWVCYQGPGASVRVKIPTNVVPSVNWYADDQRDPIPGDGGDIGDIGLSDDCSSSRMGPVLPEPVCIRSSRPLPVV